MSLYAYLVSRKLSEGDPPFDALIMAAIRKADTGNTTRLAHAFPEIHSEFFDRYHSPGGLLAHEEAP